MSRKTLIGRLMLSTGFVVGLAAPGQAQETEDTTARSSQNDIIVTAQRFEERLQDVPISMTVFNQAQIDDRNIVNPNDLTIFTPSLTSNARFGNEYASFAIRGFTQEQRTTSSVGVYFADVIAPRNSGAQAAGEGAGPGSFFDLQNVQILKGPQGTLFGRNTTGGAILLVPQKPTDQFEGYVEGTYGNYDQRRVQAVANVPLADTFRVRAGVDWNRRDGYQKNVSGVGPDRMANTDYVAARLSVVADLTPDLENYLIASYSKSTPNGSLPTVTDCFPTNFPLGTLACDQLPRTEGLGRNIVEGSLADQRQNIRQWQIINTTTWQAGDNLTIRNIASYAQVTHNQSVDLFGIRYILPATLTRPSDGRVFAGGAFTGQAFPFAASSAPPGMETSDQETFTEELQLQGNSGDGRLTWQAGGYFEKSNPLGYSGTQSQGTLACVDSSIFQCTDVLRAIGVNPSGGGTINYQVSRNTFRSIGVYAQASYALTDQLEATGGIRYTWDKSESQARKVIYNFPTPNNPVGICSNPLVRPPSRPITEPADCQQHYSKSSEAPTWLLGLDYKPADDVLLYAKWTRGYRQGSTNPFSADGYNTFDPEKVDTYEVGAKTSWRGAIPGYFNIAGFYNDFRDQQLQIGLFSFTPGVAPNVAILNAGKSRIYGTEVEFAVEPFEGFKVQASYAYLNSKLVELAPIVLLPPPFLYNLVVQQPTEGKALPLVPKHKLSVEARYDLPVDESIGQISVSAIYSYTDKVFVQDVSAGNRALLDGPTRRTLLDERDDPTWLPGYGLVNFNLDWKNIAQSGLDANVFLSNVFDKHYAVVHNLSISQGVISRYYGQPRMYGMKLRYNF